MARRRRERVSVEIPEWVWAPEDITDEGVSAWSVRVHDWAKEHLYEKDHIGLWMDVVRNSNHMPDHWKKRGSGM